jgi:5-methyltetrahydrofolate--homocysteine methyltransferase
MRKALDTLDDRSVPTLEEIVEVLGPFSSESDGTEANVDAEPRRPRRRRRATA